MAELIRTKLTLVEDEAYVDLGQRRGPAVRVQAAAESAYLAAKDQIVP